MSAFRTERLSASYFTGTGVLPAVRDVSLSISSRETLGLVGESGSGKTTFALAAIGYLPANGKVTGGSAWLGDAGLPALVLLPPPPLPAPTAIPLLPAKPIWPIFTFSRLMCVLRLAVVSAAVATTAVPC